MSITHKHDPKSPAPRVVPVEMGERSYEVRIGPGVFAHAAEIAKSKLGTNCRNAFVVVDAGLPEDATHLAIATLRAGGLNATSIALIPTEHDKSLESLGHIVREMTRRKLERSDVIVALGGGIVGDLAGFAAAVYRRGIGVIQCPTTLLSMVDASVGGKTGVNVDLAGDGSDLKKNMIGAFHQPLGVLADLDTLVSLDDRHFAAGLAECIKHGMIASEFGDAALFEWTRSNAAAIRSRESAALLELIARNVSIKATVVAGDEREENSRGGRALLNLGHTFGHAIEALPGARGVLKDGAERPGSIHHGEAVALGLRAASHCGASLGMIPVEYVYAVESLLDAFDLPARAAGLPYTQAILDRMSHDKKNIAGITRLVLPCGEGRSTVVDSPSLGVVREAIDSIRA